MVQPSGPYHPSQSRLGRTHHRLDQEIQHFSKRHLDCLSFVHSQAASLCLLLRRWTCDSGCGFLDLLSIVAACSNLEGSGSVAGLERKLLFSCLAGGWLVPLTALWGPSGSSGLHFLSGRAAQAVGSRHCSPLLLPFQSLLPYLFHHEFCSFPVSLNRLCVCFISRLSVRLGFERHLLLGQQFRIAFYSCALTFWCRGDFGMGLVFYCRSLHFGCGLASLLSRSLALEVCLSNRVSFLVPWWCSRVDFVVVQSPRKIGPWKASRPFLLQQAFGGLYQLKVAC